MLVATKVEAAPSQQAYLTASTGAAGDHFGFRVALSGDTSVVASYSSTNGAGYVFSRNGGTWNQEARLKAANWDWVGPVGVSGNTVVVGGANGIAVFVRGGIGWTQQALLSPVERAVWNSLAISGETVVGGDVSGVAYVFVRTGANWTQQAYLKASNTGAGDEFGFSVAVSGDTIVVGARLESSNATGVNGNQSDNSTPSAGAAYVFVRSGTNWTQQAYLKASNTHSNDFFAEHVAVSGDTIVIGAAGDKKVVS